MTARLVPIQPEPEVVGLEQMIAELRERGESGELSAVMVVTLSREGTPDWFHTRIPMYSAMLGAMERAKFALIQEVEE